MTRGQNQQPLQAHSVPAGLELAVQMAHGGWWHLTQEGEPGEEGSRAEAEQRQQQDDEVQRDGVGFAPPLLEQGAISTAAADQRDDGRVVVFRLSVWKRTDDCGAKRHLERKKSLLLVYKHWWFRSRRHQCNASGP